MPEKIRVYFLGTGGSTPFSGKRYPCIVLRYLNYLILFDVGEGCQFSLIEKKLHPLRHETLILITHFHADHTSGLVGLLHTYNLMGMAHKVIIVGPTGLNSFISHIMAAYLIDDFYFPIELIEIDPEEIIGKTIKILERDFFQIEAYPTKHSTYSLGYVFKEKAYYKLDPIKLEKLKVPNKLRKKLARGESVLIGNREIFPSDVAKEFLPGRKIVYTGDTMVTEKTAIVAKNADLLIHESTFLDEELALERFHSSLKGVLYLAEKANVKKLALVHISGRYSENTIKKALSDVDPNVDVIIPNDGFTISI